MTLEFIRKIEDLSGDGREKQGELYKRGDEYIFVSTIDLSYLWDKISGFLDDSFLKEIYTGLETMAFLANEDGEVIDWSGLIQERGPDGRAIVMKYLEEEE